MLGNNLFSHPIKGQIKQIHKNIIEMTTVLYDQETRFADQLLMEEEMIENTLFVLDQGWNTLIKKCAESGASVVLPNFDMSTTLLMQTIIRQGKSVIATSKELWEKVEDGFTNYPQIKQSIQIYLFDNEGNMTFPN